MKLWLDDLRLSPWGYDLTATTADECISLLQEHGEAVLHVSLDHDLDPEHYEFQDHHPGGYADPAPVWDRSKFRKKTGYAVLEWMAAENKWVKDIQIHSLSTGANDMMEFLKKNAPDGVTFRRVWPRGEV